MNFFAFNESSDLGDQLKWLREELYIAESKN